MTEDEMVGWHHRLEEHEFEQTPGVGDGQGSLACCSPRGCKESDITERLNTNSSVWPLPKPQNGPLDPRPGSKPGMWWTLSKGLDYES